MSAGNRGRIRKNRISGLNSKTYVVSRPDDLRKSDRKPFDINFAAQTIKLGGDLDDSPAVLARCRAVLERVPKFSRLTVEADELRIVPEGVDTWIAAAEEFLMGCELDYEPSQLGLVLQYDDRYRHPKSIFRNGEVTVSAF
jgi:hypothetical protein